VASSRKVPARPKRIVLLYYTYLLSPGRGLSIFTPVFGKSTCRAIFLLAEVFFLARVIHVSPYACGWDPIKLCHAKAFYAYYPSVSHFAKNSQTIALMEPYLTAYLVERPAWAE
jgi:hypothetical protein